MSRLSVHVSEVEVVDDRDGRLVARVKQGDADGVVEVHVIEHVHTIESWAKLCDATQSAAARVVGRDPRYCSEDRMADVMFSDLEVEIAACILADNYSAKGIARAVGKTEKIVEHTIRSMRHKLGLKDDGLASSKMPSVAVRLALAESRGLAPRVSAALRGLRDRDRGPEG